MTETKQMQSTNLLHSISNPISCVLTPAVFPSKEHESKVPEPRAEPPLIYTAPPCVIDIYFVINQNL